MNEYSFQNEQSFQLRRSQNVRSTLYVNRLSLSPNNVEVVNMEPKHKIRHISIHSLQKQHDSSDPNRQRFASIQLLVLHLPYSDNLQQESVEHPNTDHLSIIQF